MWILTDGETRRLLNLDNILYFATKEGYIFAYSRGGAWLKVKEIGYMSEKDALNAFVQDLRQAGLHCIALEQSGDMPET